MKRIKLFSISCFIVFCMLFCRTSDLKAQTNGAQVASSAPLSIEWKILAEDFKGSGAVLNLLKIRNHSTYSLDNTGWTLFFNGSGLLVSDPSTSPVQVEWINGDYYKMTPTAHWQVLVPGAEKSIELKINNLLNVRNIPKGFYLVTDNNKEGTLLNVNVLDNSYLELLEVKHAAEIFDKNERIDDVIDRDHLVPILPTPVYYQKKHGDFVVNQQISIAHDPRFLKESQILSRVLHEIFEEQRTDSEAQISIIYVPGLGQEGYELEVDSMGIRMYASEPAGMFYAIQSLKSLFPLDVWQHKTASFKLPAIHIKDQPRFAHRAFMMDVARNFQQKDQVFKIIDLLSFYKINVLHFHLTDDEGWRLEIPGLPELTDVGAHRGHTLDELTHLRPAYGSGPARLGNYGSGFYTRSEFIEILKYAKDRHIHVIPEIETPGHARAAVKAMESRFHRLSLLSDDEGAWQYRLADPEDQSTYKSAQAFTDNIMNVAMPSVYNFLEKVFDELILMYAEADVNLQTIHIGGDEVPNGVWEKSPIANALIQGMSSEDLGGLSNESVDGLWYYYLNKVDHILKKRGLHLSGWEEVGMKKVERQGRKTMDVDPLLSDRNFHVDVWNNVGHQIDLPYRLANAGYPVVLSNVTNYYMDLAYNTSYFENGHQWGGHVDLDKTFRFAPFDYYKSLVDNRSGKPLAGRIFEDKARLTLNGKKNIIGIQAPLWSEFILGPERQEFMLLPKILGLVERAWAAESTWESVQDSGAREDLYRRDWTRFVHQVGSIDLPRLDHLFGGFLYRIPTAGLLLKEGKWHANTQIPSFLIRYTTNGTEPTETSPIYLDPIPVIPGTQFVFRVFNREGRAGRSIRVYN